MKQYFSAILWISFDQSTVHTSFERSWHDKLCWQIFFWFENAMFVYDLILFFYYFHAFSSKNNSVLKQQYNLHCKYINWNLGHSEKLYLGKYIYPGSMRQASHQPSNPVYYIEDCRISKVQGKLIGFGTQLLCRLY